MVRIFAHVNVSILVLFKWLFFMMFELRVQCSAVSACNYWVGGHLWI